jgi:1-deoxy-D-xylulose-5-phosphate synthase
MVVMTPADEDECRQMLYTGFFLDRPAAVRYPRGAGAGVVPKDAMQSLPIGKAEVRRSGRKIAILAFGTLLKSALEAGETLDATVVNMRFVKPIDASLVEEIAKGHELVVTVEENVVAGGAGAAVAETLAERGISTGVLHLGLPDRFIDHGDQAQLMASVGLDTAGILAAVRARLGG